MIEPSKRDNFLCQTGISSRDTPFAQCGALAASELWKRAGKPLAWANSLGSDVGKNKIAVGILRWDEQVPDTEMLFTDEPTVRRLIGRFDDPGGLQVCYKAGPTGFGLYRDRKVGA